MLVAPTETVFVTDGRYAEQARREVPDVERVTTSRLVPAAGERARDLGLRRLGFEGTLPFREHGALAEAAAGVELVAVNGAVERLRATKDADEVAAIRRAQEITDASLRGRAAAAGRGRHGAGGRARPGGRGAPARRGATRVRPDRGVRRGGGRAASPPGRASALPRGRREDRLRCPRGRLSRRHDAHGRPRRPARELLAVYDVVRAAQASAAASLTAGARPGSWTRPRDRSSPRRGTGTAALIPSATASASRSTSGRSCEREPRIACRPAP